MQPLSAIDAIAPAFTRTHEILFRPFRLGRSWKLAVSQYLGLMGAFFTPLPLFLVLIPSSSLHLGFARIAIFLLLAIGTLIFFVIFYLCLRMQFVNFEMIVTRAQFIAPMWRRYGSRVWPVIAFKCVLGTVLPLAMVPLLWNAGKSAFHAIQNMPNFEPGQPPDMQLFQTMFAHLLGFYAIMICGFLFLKIFSTTFEDFAMPFFILEDITLTEAIRRGAAVFLDSPLQCLLYLILKLILSIAGFIIQYISNLVVLIPVLIVVAIAAVMSIVAKAVLHGAQGIGQVIFVFVIVILYVVVYAALFWYQTGTLGYLATLLEAYAIYFLGGRYPLLGNMLEPGPGEPFTPPPVFPSEEERRDDDGGPPMPMDPAVA